MKKSPNEEDARSRLRFRTAIPTDLSQCLALEQASYPSDEAASKSALQYRQHYAASYFRCAYLLKEGETNPSVDEDAEQQIVGFICATRCHEFNHASMSRHHSGGPLLAIHSVVIAQEYRRRGWAKAMMLDYVRQLQTTLLSNESSPNNSNHGGSGTAVEKVVLMAKSHLLGFYVQCGFTVTRCSSIVHGKDLWYDLELDLTKGRDDNRTSFHYNVMDSFADMDVFGQKNTGNPAAIVTLPPLEDVVEEHPSQNSDWMLQVAHEFNFSETAFVWPCKTDSKNKQVRVEQKEEQHWSIRYFTPTVEVDLCGHATLAASAALYNALPPSCDKQKVSIVFHANKDVLHTSFGGSPHISTTNNETSRTIFTASKITMKLPFLAPTMISNSSSTVAVVEAMLVDAFGIRMDDILFFGVSTELGDLLIELTESSFRRLQVLNLAALMTDALSDVGYTRGVILCATTTKEDENSPDFLSRFFGPKAGIDEDPVTGSAHSALGPYFSDKFGKARVIGKQMSHRGGVVECFVQKGKESVASTSTTDDSSSFVAITGTAAQFMSGQLSI